MKQILQHLTVCLLLMAFLALHATRVWGQASVFSKEDVYLEAIRDFQYGNSVDYSPGWFLQKGTDALPYYFADAYGKKQPYLGAWEKAEPFDHLGFAKVYKYGKHYMLDTLGEAYPMAWKINEITPETKALVLSYQYLDSIPTKVFDHEQLEILILSQTAVLQHIPSEIGRLKNLRVLDIHESDIGTLPEEIGSLQQLEVFDASNTLEHVPDGFFRLKNLKWLKAPGGIAQKIYLIGALENLERLSLLYANLDSLPESIGQLQQLKRLNLSNNALKDLPSSMSGLHQLKILDISGNQFSALPPVLNQLKVEYLNLRDNPIQQWPSWFGQLSSLRWLSIRNGREATGELPSNIGGLKNLEVLLLSMSRLKELPPSIGQLESLQHFMLEDSDSLQYLPKELGNLKNLKILELRRLKQLKELPDLWPPALRSLYLDACTNLQTLSTLGQGLKELSIGACPYLRELPKDLGNLESLSIVSCLSMESLPKSVFNSKRLKMLKWLSINAQEIPIDIKNLKNLEQLTIWMSDLSHVPKEIMGLPKLKLLHLDDNHTLKTLPFGILNMPNLQGLSLNNTSSLDWEGLLQHLKVHQINASFTFSETTPIKAKLRICISFGELEKVLLMAPDSMLYDLEVENWDFAGDFFCEKNYACAYKCAQLTTRKSPDIPSVWLSWYALFAQQYQHAIDAAHQSLVLDPENTAVYSQMALGYLLNDQYEKAEAIFLEWKDQKFKGRDQTGKSIFLKYIDALRQAGIEHPDFKKAEQLLKE